MGADKRRQVVAGRAQARRADLGQCLNAQECVGGCLGQPGAVGLAPIPAAADRAGVVAVDHLAGLWRLIHRSAERHKRLAAASAGQANIAVDGGQVFAAAGFDPCAIAALTDDPAVKAALKATTDEAARCVTGMPA